MQENKNIIHQKIEGEWVGNNPFFVRENYVKYRRVNNKFILREW